MGETNKANPADRRKQATTAELIEKARDYVMSPAEVAAQRKNWVCGELLLRYRSMTYDQAAALFDQVAASALTNRTHSLKVWPQQFEELATGRKTFEFRKDDRGFMVGDALRLQEFNPEADDFTGRVLVRHVTHILAEGFGLPEGHVVMSLEHGEKP